MLKLNHLAIPYLAALLFLFGSIISMDGVRWYRTLTLPPWGPSEGLIALIWLTIYVLMALAALRVWNDARRDHSFRVVMALMALAFIVNLSWALLFFHFHDFAASALAALVLGAFLSAAILLLSRRDPRAALLMAPFLLWVLFAAYFNYTLGILNS